MIQCPKISVLMSVYNGEKYLREAIVSILNQTFGDFEFIIINDASTDKSMDIIESYNDTRILLINNEINLGLTKSLNKGIRIARGEYIARMDADDVSKCNRLAIQSQFLDQHQDISFCGSDVSYFNQPDKINIYHYLTHECLKVAMMAANPFVHPTMIWRKSDFIKDNLFYNENFLVAQDYELWSRAIMKLKSSNLPERLLLYRLHDNQIGENYFQKQSQYAHQIKLSFLDALGIEPDEMQKKWHFCIFGDGLSKFRTLEDLRNIEYWFNFILSVNDKKNVFNKTCLINFWAAKIFKQGLYYNSIPIWRWSRKSLIRSANNITIAEKFKLFVKSLIRKSNK